MIISEILTLNDLAREDGKKFVKRRMLYQRIKSESGKHFVGIVGPRGVGKSVLLKQLLSSDPDSFYLSADTLDESNLFQVASVLSDQYKIKRLLIDEIHFCKSYARDLKKIYDFLDVRIIFTSSVSLSLFDSAYDLSRRVRLRFMHPFSFREYILFTKDVDIPKLSIANIFEGQWTTDHMRYNHLFDEYLQGRLFPFSLEEPDFMPLLKNVCQKVIRKDIPSVSNLRFDDVEKIEKVLEFIGKSEVDGINFTSISKNLGITKYKAELFVKLLARAFILNPVYPAGTNVLKEPKILMYLPFRLLFRDWSRCVGPVREDFFAEIVSIKGYEFHYLKTKRGEKTPDFLVKFNDEQIVIEIGGKGKGREQFKGITIKKKLILSHGTVNGRNSKPLSLLGFII